MLSSSFSGPCAVLAAITGWASTAARASAGKASFSSTSVAMPDALGMKRPSLAQGGLRHLPCTASGVNVKSLQHCLNILRAHCFLEWIHAPDALYVDSSQPDRHGGPGNSGRPEPAGRCL